MSVLTPQVQSSCKQYTVCENYFVTQAMLELDLNVCNTSMMADLMKECSEDQVSPSCPPLMGCILNAADASFEGLINYEHAQQALHSQLARSCTQRHPWIAPTPIYAPGADYSPRRHNYVFFNEGADEAH
ncbi:hypothetical protein HOY80DRAFT_1137484 [Tuber brumale]|nr:hypothetical protein HOY80DRAFT_1137484 [Tuber brumale]